MKKRLLALALAALVTATLPLPAVAAENQSSPLPVEETVLEADQPQIPEEEDAQPELLTGEETPSEETPDDEETPGEETPDEKPDGEETPDEETPDEETPDEETPDEETPDEEEPVLPSFNTQEHVIYIEGNEDKVRADDGMTRAEASKMIYTLLVDPLPGDGTSFPDVPANSWYETYVNSMAAMGLIKGYDDGAAFLPGRHITRAEFVTILSRVLPAEEGLELDLSALFPDGDNDHWAYDALCNAVDRGWLSGYEEDGTLRPNDQVTRAQAITILNRLLGRSADRAAIDAAGKIFQYIDLKLTHWAYYDIMEASVPHTPSASETGAEIWSTFTPVKAERAPGYYLEKGQLYCVGSDGYYLRNESNGVLDFNDMGQYTSGNAKLDGYLTTLVNLYYNPKASRFVNLRTFYYFVVNNCEYRNNLVYIPQGATDWEADSALRMINDGYWGNCYNYAALFTMLARRLGYQATGISGTVTAGYEWGWEYDTHGWVEINEGGKIYVCDPEETWAYGWDLFYKPYGTTYTHYMVNGVSLG